jgi:iron complex transport system substrate-binding protein
MPLEWAREFPATGGTVEEVLALDPDIVVASSFLPPATKQAFERLGIRVETFGIATTLDEDEEQVNRVAALTGDPDAGALLEMETSTWLDETRWDGPKADALLWQEGGIVPGERTLIAALLEHTGFASHSASRGLGQASYVPLEEVLADPPQVIITAGSERMLHHPVLRELKGTRYEQLDPSLLFCGGPSIQRAVKRLAEIRRHVG